MGRHKGWVVIDRWATDRPARTGSRWLARAWTPGQGYCSKSYPDGQRRQAAEWAQAQAGQAAQAAQPGAALADLLPLYLTDLERRGRSPDYRAQVDRMLRDAVEAGVGDLGSPRVLLQAEAWMDAAKPLHPHWGKRSLTARTRNKRRLALRSVVRWALDRGLIERDHLRGLKAETQTDPLKSTFTLDECRRLWPATAKQHDYRMLIAVMLSAGLRLSEAATLTWSQIEWEARRITVVGKRRKERTVPLQADLAELLKGLHRPDRPAPSGPLFPGFNHGDRSKHCRLFDGACTAAGVPRGKRTPHSCRHTWVCLMLATGENAPLVMLYAGHETLATTAAYARSQVGYRDAVEGWPRGVLRLAPQPEPSPAAGRPAARSPRRKKPQQ